MSRAMGLSRHPFMEDMDLEFCSNPNVTYERLCAYVCVCACSRSRMYACLHIFQSLLNYSLLLTKYFRGIILRMRWAGNRGIIGEIKRAYRILMRKPEEQRPFGRPRRRWKGNIKRYLQEIGWSMGLGWSGSGQGKVARSCENGNKMSWLAEELPV